MTTAPTPSSVAAEGSTAGGGLPNRLLSLDVFRGLTMIWMISNGFGLQFFRDHPVIRPVALQFTHAAWVGMNAWDLVQPFFMFIVGAALPFAYSKRSGAGMGWRQGWPRVLRRCLLLLLCASIVHTWAARRPIVSLMNVLGQIALTYPCAYLLVGSGRITQAAAAMGALALHTAAFVAAGSGWERDTNAGGQLDRLILGSDWGGGYVTLNFLSAAANTVFGMMAGWLLVSSRTARDKVGLLVAWGIAAIGGGLLLSAAGVPMIKRIWTASFALYATGFSLLALGAAYWLVDVRQWRWGTAIPAIVGANSIFIYMFHQMLYPVSQRAAVLLIGPASAGTALPRLLWELAFIGLQIGVCWTLYRRHIFFKL